MLSEKYTVEHETLIIEGLKGSYRIMQLSDSHMSLDSELDDEKTRERAEKQREVWRQHGNGLSQLENFRTLVEYGKENGVDMFLFAGDMADFQSKGTAHEAYLEFEKVGKYMYVLGNHETGKKFYEFYLESTNNSPEFQVMELGELLIVGIDNGLHSVSDEVMEKLEKLFGGDRPVIFMHHVPLDCETLHPDAVKFWADVKYFLFGLSGDGKNVKEYYELLGEKKTNLKAVIAGHLHFAHVDTLPNGVPQYVSAPCLAGYGRIIDIKGN